jgi:hypothetical protein
MVSAAAGTKQHSFPAKDSCPSQKVFDLTSTVQNTLHYDAVVERFKEDYVPAMRNPPPTSVKMVYRFTHRRLLGQQSELGLNLIEPTPCGARIVASNPIRNGQQIFFDQSGAVDPGH